MTMMLLLGRLSIPHRIAGFALAATLFVLVLLGLAHRNIRGEILESPPASSLRSESHVALELEEPLEDEAAAAAVIPAVEDGEEAAEDEPYYVFLQKFPLQNSFKMLFHTEVVVCPRGTFADDAAFLDALDGLLDGLAPSRFGGTAVVRESAGTASFAAVDEHLWSRQSKPGCVQLGYGGANCGMGCCGSPHKSDNTHYALNSHKAVIGNAMGEHKELYLYGTSSGDGGGISGSDAYKAVCHGHMNAVEMGGLPKCVSDWAGRDYNPLTNNCNTFTSAVLKCVYGLSDAKPHLGVSDMINVKCPKETGEDGMEIQQCTIPAMDEGFGREDEAALSSH